MKISLQRPPSQTTVGQRHRALDCKWSQRLGYRATATSKGQGANPDHRRWECASSPLPKPKSLALRRYCGHVRPAALTPRQRAPLAVVVAAAPQAARSTMPAPRNLRGPARTTASAVVLQRQGAAPTLQSAEHQLRPRRAEHQRCSPPARLRAAARSRWHHASRQAGRSPPEGHLRSSGVSQAPPVLAVVVAQSARSVDRHRRRQEARPSALGRLQQAFASPCRGASSPRRGTSSLRHFASRPAPPQRRFGAAAWPRHARPAVHSAGSEVARRPRLLPELHYLREVSQPPLEGSGPRRGVLPEALGLRSPPLMS
mmetsp:Transcript_21793/g.48171  ORF Transcript_21793/g.48171 Transcript_21793/m.48171 type:complete len:314 (-) Transcript_21793:689-1630(-)